MDALIPVAVVLASYLLGSLSFAVIVSRLMGLNDPRSYGSKNPGATNVLRSGSKKAAILTLLLDTSKAGCRWQWCWLGGLNTVWALRLQRSRAWPRFWAICTRFFSGLWEARVWPRRWVWSLV